VVEGVRAAPEVLRLAQQLQVELPLLEMAGAVIAGQVTPVEALKRLADRPLRAEAG
jgi:glycerol-3-phosphate dehydrogenase (NAD(P)+)